MMAALDGVRVLDLIEHAGAYAARLLAGLGADVLRIEPPGGGAHRHRAPFVDGRDGERISLYDLHYHRGARRLALAIETPAGQARLRDLLNEVQIVLDNGQLARLGLDPRALAEKQPPLVVISVTPFGLESARAHWQGGDLICQAMSGLINLYGYHNERPARFGGEQASQMAGLAAALGALVGLAGLERDGVGECVDVAIERAAAFPTLQFGNASIYHQFGYENRRKPRRETLHGQIYRAADGWITFGAYRDADALVQMLQDAGMAEDLPLLRRTLTHAQFIADPQVEEVVARFFASQPKMELIERANNRYGLSGLPINTAADLVADPFLLERDFFIEVGERETGRTLLDSGPPVRMADGGLQIADSVAEPPYRHEPPSAVAAPRNPQSAIRNPQSNASPLAGLRILDLGWIVAGPLTSRLLADFGADVIKVESSTRMDVGRGNRTPLYGPLPGDANSNPDVGGYFQDVNSGKRSVTLNLASAEGRALLKRLVTVSDAIVSNLHGDQLARWGLSYAEAARLNPGIIIVNMPTMASEGPRVRWRAFGDWFAGAAGLKSVSGRPEDPPLPFGHHYPDFGPNPFHAAIALLAALRVRARTSVGQFIEVSQYESTIGVLGPAILEYSATGIAPTPQANRDPQAAPHNIYRCTGDESFCAIACYTDTHWQTLQAIDGLEGLRRPAWHTLEERTQHEAEIDTIIERWTLAWDRQQLAVFLQERGVPAGPYQSLAEMVELDPVLGDAYFHRLLHPCGREFLVPDNPARAWRHPANIRLGPLLGEHTFDVLQDVLGLSTDEIAAYALSGAIE